MIGHDAAGDQIVSFAIELLDVFHYDVGNTLVCLPAGTIFYTAVEPVIKMSKIFPFQLEKIILLCFAFELS
jgi:hypothetical protein